MGIHAGGNTAPECGMDERQLLSGRNVPRSLSFLWSKFVAFEVRYDRLNGQILLKKVSKFNYLYIHIHIPFDIDAHTSLHIYTFSK